MKTITKLVTVKTARVTKLVNTVKDTVKKMMLSAIDSDR